MNGEKQRAVSARAKSPLIEDAMPCFVMQYTEIVSFGNEENKGENERISCCAFDWLLLSF